MQPQRGNAIWLAKVEQYLHSARPTREGILLSIQNTVSTPVCQTVCSSRHAAVFQVGTRGPDVAGAIEEHIAGEWHIILLLEAIEYLQHECLMNLFYITLDFAILTLFCGHGFFCPRDSLRKGRSSTSEFSIIPEVPNAPFCGSQGPQSLFCVYFESVRPTQKPNGFRTKQSFLNPRQQQKCNHTFPNTQRSTLHRLPIIVVISAVSVAMLSASHICNDSVMSYRSLTERKLSLLCRRYVTLGNEEADISFGNVALFFGAWKPMTERDLERFVDKPRWFEFRVVASKRKFCR